MGLLFFRCLSLLRLLHQRTSASILAQVICHIIFFTMSSATTKLLFSGDQLAVAMML